MPSDARPTIDYGEYLNYESKNRTRSQIKNLRPYFEKPGMISFGGGYPHPSTWPVNGMTLSVPFAKESVFVPGYNCPTPDKLLPLAEYTPLPKDAELAPNLTGELQYGRTWGADHFVKFWTEHIKRVHNPPYSEWQTHNTAGNTDGVDGLLRCLCTRGDSMLVEEFAYPGTIEAAKSQGIYLPGVAMDGDGIIPEDLDKIMTEWDDAAHGAKKPKLLMMVPTCSNPTGYTAPAERRKAIYDVCKKHALLIIEDDPYCFLQIRPKGAESPIVPSYLSMDTDGRVIRLDSFSKIVAPGSRCGWMTGPTPIVTAVMNRSEASTGTPSGFTTAAIASVIRAWGGHEGFENKYLPYISNIYKERCLAMISFFEKYLPKDACEWPEGKGGMFIWLRLRCETHPDIGTKDPEDISEKVFQAAVNDLVLFVPSKFFKAPGGQKWTKDQEARRIFARICYATPTLEELEEGVKRLGRVLRREWKLADSA